MSSVFFALGFVVVVFEDVNVILDGMVGVLPRCFRACREHGARVHRYGVRVSTRTSLLLQRT